MEKKQKKRRRKRTPMTVVRTRRSIFLGGVLILCIFGLIFRMWYLQDNYAEEYDQWSAAQRARRDIDRTSATFAPVRGGFVDRHMQPITGTQQVYTVVLDVESLHDRHRRNTGNTDIREEVFNAIMMELGVPRYRLTEMFHTDDYGNLAMTAGRRRQVLATDVPREIAVPLTDMFADLHREETSLRRYNDPYFAPQVIGFSRGDAMWGLERQYDRQLSGVVGRNTWVQGETETIPVQDGYTIITTLDGEIQRLAQYYCDNTYIQHPSQQVGMIVMDPFTGEILAMAQAPTFSLDEPYDPDYFTSPELAEMWNLLTPEQQTDEVMLLWRNYHTTRSSEPGSIFKPFVVAAAIEEGIINQGNNYTCEGVRRISDMEVRCHNQNGCGYLSLSTAIYRSCNLAMATINRDMGRDLFYQYRGYFGFGERTGIDLPGEESVSSPAVMYPYSRLHALEMATSAMGQGFNATTIQTITGYTALINGGDLMRPYLVSQIVDSRNTIVYENEPAVVRRVISPETSAIMRYELEQVVARRPGRADELAGSGFRAYIAGHTIGGKTGTAQQGARDAGNHNLSFVAFMPVNNPQYLVLMTIDHIEDSRRYGGDTVTPIVREFFLDLIRLKGIRPTTNDDDNAIATELIGNPMPDFTGVRVSDAVRNILNRRTVGYQVVGGGTTVSHTWPAADQQFPTSNPVILYTDPDTRISERMVSVPNVTNLRAENAEFLLTEAGLIPILFQETRTNNIIPDSVNDRTAQPEPATNSTPAPINYTVFQQYPTPGTEIEQGTQVMIRAR